MVINKIVSNHSRRKDGALRSSPRFGRRIRNLPKKRRLTQHVLTDLTSVRASRRLQFAPATAC